MDRLFDKWEHRHPGHLFVRDGIINPALWSTAPQRIVFLLKENNCAPNSESGRARPEYQRDFRLLCNERPWPEIGQWAYGLLHLSADPPFEEAKAHFRDACRQIAVVNLKKTAGGNSSSSREIADYARRDADLLREQLSLLNPDIVVCCGKSLVHGLASQLFEDARDAEVVATTSAGRVLRGPMTMWIDYFHPQMRKGSRETKYRLLVDLAKAANNAVQQTGARVARPGC